MTTPSTGQTEEQLAPLSRGADSLGVSSAAADCSRLHSHPIVRRGERHRVIGPFTHPPIVETGGSQRHARNLAKVTEAGYPFVLPSCGRHDAMSSPDGRAPISTTASSTVVRNGPRPRRTSLGN
jgi:hypothetical protein